MVTANSPPVSLRNYLLAALPEHEYQRLLPDLQRVELTCGQVLYEPGEEIQFNYFPLNSVICLMALMEDGSNIGVGIIGKEGMVGLPLFLGSNTTPNQALVKIAGSAIRMRAGVFRKAAEESGFNSLLHRYTQALLTQAAQAAACNRFHTIRPALANWLLSIHDRTDGPELKITHELISTMMGVRRAGVTNAVLELQDEGLIRGTRGVIRVIDRQGLEAASCECYELVKKEFNRLAVEDTENSKIRKWNGIERRDGELTHKRDLQRLLEINSRLLMAGIREQEARDQAEEANKAKDEFLATLSHELRTPLTAMLGWTRLVRTAKLDDVTFLRALETIERSAQAQAQLIEDMLDVSRIVAGKLTLQIRQVDLSSIIQTGINVVRPMADNKHIQINYTCDSKINSLTGDPKRLQQVVLNLLTNALKFTPRDGRVEVRLTRANYYAEITVRDSGQGITPDFLPYVFDRFRQGNGAVRKHSAGLGLGLAIVQHLVKLHGGNVRAESAGHEQGAMFTVELPLTLNEAEARDTEHSVETNSNTVDELECAGTLEDLRLLVIEDDADTRELITFILEECGAVVTSVTSAREALDVLAHSKIDILLSDIGLSDHDGYELIRQVRLLDNQNARNVPAIALTACATADDQRRALSAGFQFHVPKPVEPSELIAVVSRLAAAI
jgi:signal transduction histidine kinase/CRP-like cAMP-binding protein/ActR/RegA family two-component response regulator